MPLTPADPALVQALADRLPEGCVTTPTEAYLTEPRGRFRGASAAVLRPRSVSEVAEILRFANDHRVGVVPYAGGTGLVSGQVAEGVPSLLLSVERLNEIASVSAQDNILVAGAGAILADVQTAAAGVGRLFPLSLASEGSARIGGLLSTNAGGVQVLRYGNARELCLGLEAVMPDGSVYRGLKRLRKDNTGYDLRNLLIGSEGSLGVITGASLRLFPRPVEVSTALVAVADPTAALELLHRMRDHIGDGVSAFELMHQQGLAFLAEAFPDIPQPFETKPEWAVLIEAGGARGSMMEARVEVALAAALDDGLASDAVVAQNHAQARTFWSLRESIPLANRHIGAVASHDISVPVALVPDFIAQAAPVVHGVDPSFRINCFGHLGDGNLHYNIFPAAGRARRDYDDKREAVTRAVHDLVHAMDGSISAEHGIGRLKLRDLERYGDPAKLAAMRAIKAALDPLGIMNPGAVLQNS